MKNNIARVIILLAGLAFVTFLFIGNCKREHLHQTDSESKEPKSSNKISLRPAPDFNADSAFAYTIKQISFGPRIPGSKEHYACGLWLTATLKRFSDTLYIQEDKVKIYDGSAVPMRNIIAVFNPKAQKRILLFAHWDTRPYADQDKKNNKAKFEGADDGAASSAILIEMARVLAKQKPEVGIDLALFDVEDYGAHKDDKKQEEQDTYALGTQFWCRHPHTKNYKAYYGVLLDMCSAYGAQLRMEGHSMLYAPSVVQTVWNVAATLGYGQLFVNERAQAIIDDHYYVNKIAGIPSIDLIWLDQNTATGFAPHWHTTNDNIRIIDKNNMKAVGQTLLTVLFNEKPTT